MSAYSVAVAVGGGTLLLLQVVALLILFVFRKEFFVRFRSPVILTIQGIFVTLVSAVLLAQEWTWAHGDKFPACWAIETLALIFPALAVFPYILRSAKIVVQYNQVARQRYHFIMRDSFQATATTLAVMVHLGLPLLATHADPSQLNVESLTRHQPSGTCFMWSAWYFFAPQFLLYAVPIYLVGRHIATVDTIFGFREDFRQTVRGWMVCAVVYFVGLTAGSLSSDVASFLEDYLHLHWFIVACQVNTLWATSFLPYKKLREHSQQMKIIHRFSQKLTTSSRRSTRGKKSDEVERGSQPIHVIKRKKHSIDDVLAHSFDAFREFAVKSLCGESVDFLEAVEEFKKQATRQNLSSICRTFIMPGAPFLINISGTLATKILRVRDSWNQTSVEERRTILDEARQEIVNLLQTNLLQSFVMDQNNHDEQAIKRSSVAFDRLAVVELGNLTGGRNSAFRPSLSNSFSSPSRFSWWGKPRGRSMLG